MDIVKRTLTRFDNRVRETFFLSQLPSQLPRYTRDSCDFSEPNHLRIDRFVELSMKLILILGTYRSKGSFNLRRFKHLNYRSVREIERCAPFFRINSKRY